MRHIKINHIDADSIVYAAACTTEQHYFYIVSGWSIIHIPRAGAESSKVWRDKNYPNLDIIHRRVVEPLAHTLGLIKKKIDSIKENTKGYTPTLYLTHADLKKNFRFHLAKTLPYKGNRKSYMKPAHYEEARQYILKYYPTEVCEGYEADDAVIMNYQPGDIISAIDKDLFQFPAKFYNYNTEATFTVSEEEGRLNFWTQVWCGDTIDNIPGMSHWCKKARIGIKRIQKMFEGCVGDDEFKEVITDLYHKQCDEHNEYGERIAEQIVLLRMLRSEEEYEAIKEVLKHGS